MCDMAALVFYSKIVKEMTVGIKHYNMNAIYLKASQCSVMFGIFITIYYCICFSTAFLISFRRIRTPAARMEERLAFT